MSKTIKIPGGSVAALTNILNGIAAGKPVDPAELGAAMPAVRALQDVVDSKTAIRGFTVLTDAKD